jgi:ketosteroid isomerase-like protein
MSENLQGDVQRLRDGYVAFNRGDWDEAMELAHPECEWRMHGALAMDAPHATRGREAVKAFWSDFFELWDDYKVEPLDFREGSGGTILATVRFTGRGKGSDVPVELMYFWVYVFRDGRAVSCDLYADRGDALKAAGLAG